MRRAKGKIKIRATTKQEKKRKRKRRGRLLWIKWQQKIWTRTEVGQTSKEKKRKEVQYIGKKTNDGGVREDANTTVAGKTYWRKCKK